MSSIDEQLAADIERYRERLCIRKGDRWICKCGNELSKDNTFRCDACLEESRRKREREQLRQQTERHLATITGRANRPLGPLPEWEHGRIDSPIFQAKIHPTFQRFAAKYEPKHGSVALLGPSGAGKTTAAAAMFRRLADDRLRAEKERKQWDISLELDRWSQALWTTAHQIAKARKQHKLGDDDAPLVLECISCPLLVIDEMGFEPPSEALFEIVDARYSKRKPTIITSGLSSAEFSARYGVAMLRRLTDGGVGKLVEVPGA